MKWDFPYELKSTFKWTIFGIIPKYSVWYISEKIVHTKKETYLKDTSMKI
jgi:hypothetical protein